MQQDTTGSTSRRTFVKYGLLSTGAIVAPSSAVTADSSANRTDESGSDRPVERGVMRSYQYIPGSRVTVENALGWQPERLEEPHRTHVVTYDDSPSYQAFLFTNAEGENGGPETETAALQPGDSLALEGIEGSPDGTNNRYVTVGVTAGDPGDASPTDT